MARSRRRRSTAKRSSRGRPKPPAMHKVLRLVEERLPKDPYDWEDFRVDDQGRVRHGWHPAHTLYARVASAWVKVAYWCQECGVGQLVIPPS